MKLAWWDPVLPISFSEGKQLMRSQKERRLIKLEICWWVPWCGWGNLQACWLVSAHWSRVGRQVAMAWEWEHRERAQVMHSRRSCRHILESDWERDWTPLVPQSSGQRRFPSPYLSGEEQLAGSPAPCLGPKHKDPFSSPVTSSRGWGAWRHGAWRDKRNPGVGRHKWKSGPAMDLTSLSSPSPPRPLPNGGYLVDSSVNSRTSVSMVTSHSSWLWCSKRSTMKVYLPLFKSTNENADVTYSNCHFDVQQHQLNHTGESLFPHIYQLLQGFPGKLARSLGKVPSLDDLLAKLNDYFGVVKELDAMNRHLYTIKQGTKEWMTEFAMRLCCQIRDI